MSTDNLTLSPPPVDVDQLDTAKPLVEIFQPFAVTLEKWAAKAKTMVVTDINQRTEMAQARLARLEIKETRVAMERTRVGLVEKLKERTSKIDAVARGYRVKMESLEEELRQSEEFAIRHAAKLKAELKLQREAELLQFTSGPVLVDLSDLSDKDYAFVLSDAKLLHQAKIDAANKAEAERKAKEEADLAERKRVAAENARLKAEAVEKARLAEEQRKRDADEAAKVLAELNLRFERQQAEQKRVWAEEEAKRAEERRKTKEEADLLAAIVRKEHEEAMTKAMTERRAIEAKAKAEAAAAAKARAELAAKAKAEAKEKARIEKAKRDAELAPDYKKLQLFAQVLRGLQIPTLQTLDLDLAGKVEEWAQWVEARIEEGAE